MVNNRYINKGKVVLKPWGKEIWLELNDKYCYKRIHINSGFKTSYQIHNFKLETNFIISGEAEVWLENDDGIVEKFIMNAGDFFTVVPKRKHRVIAITDIILQEVSTPEVDDVIRIDDEFGRKDGRISWEHAKPVVCIIAAGTGSRLGDMGKICHKTLLPLNNKAIISYLIEKFDDCDIVIAIGYLKEQIREYVNLFHSDRNIKFIEVDTYSGGGSGTAHSLECCRQELQKPFYFCVSDFYTTNDIQNSGFLQKNWISISDTNEPDKYSTVKVTNGVIEKLIDKDQNGYDKAFTGIFYMYDYELFWNQFDKYVNDRKSVIDVFKDIKKFNFEAKRIDMSDMGSCSLYFELLDKYEGKNLHLHKKKYENKYIKDDIFIKAGEKNKINKLFSRYQHLQEHVPKLLFKGDHFYSYEYFPGKTLYEINNKQTYLEFLAWFEYNFCKKISASMEYKHYAREFYYNKTNNRVTLFKSNNDFSYLDNINVINDKRILKLDDYLNQIDWEDLYNIIPTRLFHGDLQFDNIIYDGTDFKLIDWREDFGDNIECGDLYYDFAKLYGGMILNYSKMKNNKNFSFIINDHSAVLKNYDDEILIDILNNEMVSLIKRNNLDQKKIKLLTAIIFLNMSPLHVNNFDKFVFLKSKELLAELFFDMSVLPI